MILLYLKDLYVTHNELRNVDSVKHHLNQYSTNGLIDNNKKIIIADFGDKCFVRDGHHFAVFLYHISKQISPNEEPLIAPKFYDKEYYEYKDWKHSNLDIGWCTPLNLHTHVRKCELLEFKQTVKEIITTNGKTAADHFIRTNTHLYLEEREVFTVKDLYEKYRETL